MTAEEFNKYILRIGSYIYECTGVDCTNKDTGNEINISERECIALACGLNAAHAISNLTPNKPVDAMTNEDIARDAESLFKTLAEIFERFAKEGEAE